MSAKKKITPSQKARASNSMEEGRKIIEQKIGKIAADKYFSPRKNKARESNDDKFKRVLSDLKSDDKLYVAKVDPTLRCYRIDPDLTRAVAITLCVESIGNDCTVSDAHAYIASRLSAMTDDEKGKWRKWIKVMKSKSAKSIRDNKRAIVLTLANEFRLKNGGLIERKIELYHFIRDNAEGVWFPPAENYQEWTKIMRAAGLGHVGLHSGKGE
jgi:hypothetical protein